MTASPLPYPQSSVLFVDVGRVEWLGPESGGERPYGSAEVANATPQALANSAEALRQASTPLSGGDESRRDACVLALGPGLARQGRVRLPELSDRDARRVLHRKAAHRIGGTLDDTLYSARSTGARCAGKENWDLVGLPRGFVTQLSGELRSRGFRIGRTVVARQARSSHALERLRSETATALIVSLEQDAVVLSLVAASDLVTESVLAGDYRTSPATAMTLIPEARRLASYWRKQSRGAALDAVIVVGLDADRAQVLEQALASALSEVRVLCVPEQGDPAAARVHALAACAASGSLDRELSLPMPRRGRTRLGLGAALIAMIGLAGVSVQNSVETELQQWNAQITELERSRADLALAGRTAREVDRAADRLRAVEQRLEATRTWGLPFEELIGDALRVTAQDSTWTSIEVSRGDTGYDVELSGVTADDPARSWAVLERLTTELERSACFTRVNLVPPSLSSSKLQPFTFEAQVEGFSFEQEAGPEPASAGGGLP